MFGRFLIEKEGVKEVLSIDVLKQPKDILTKSETSSLLKQTSILVSDSWGEFSDSYLRKSVLDVYLLCLIKNSKNEIIALAPVKKLKINGRQIYSFGLTVVSPKYRRLNLLKIMGMRLARTVILENLLRLRFKLEVVFITPNIWTIGLIARRSEFIYPKPYQVGKRGELPEADSETLDTVRQVINITGEKYRSLDREGCVMEGFYDDKKGLIVEARKHKDKLLNLFADRYLYATKGREIVIRAILSPLSIIFGGAK